MNNFKKLLINKNISAKSALKKLDDLNSEKILFLTNQSNELKASLTDGDLRRGFLKGLNLEDPIFEFSNCNPKFILNNNFLQSDFNKLKKMKISVVPVLDSKRRVIDIIDVGNQLGHIPVDAILMAGGFGTRLGSLTKNTPKSLIKIQNKAIIDYSIDRLKKFGVSNFNFCLFHMKEKIKKHINNKYLDINTNFVEEKKPLGTIGAVSLIKEIEKDYVLLMNADILTNINFSNFFENFLNEDADISVATIPHKVSIPYAVTNISKNEIISLDEKPTYTYQSNAAVYLIKKSILKLIPKNKKFDATDLINLLIKNKKYKVLSYELNEYWSDIGTINDLQKTKKDIKNLNL